MKMALRSILGNKGRSILTMLGIIIGIASVMTIVSVVNGQNQQSLKQFEAMGTNRISVSLSMFDGRDCFEDLYNYCNGLGNDLVVGVTPSGMASATIVYGTKNSDAMQKNQENMFSEDGAVRTDVELPPDLYYGSDQYAVCNNYKLEKGRDLSFLDIRQHSQVCVLGARAARNFFGYSDPLGKDLSVNGYPFKVVGVYAEKDPDSAFSQDNVIIFPYTASRLLSPGQSISDFVVKAASREATEEAITRLNGFLSGLTGNGERGWGNAYSDNQWQNTLNEQAAMMSMVLGGIAAISLLVGGIGIMNIMYVSVTERTREIGLRMSVGARGVDILSQFLIEAILISITGGLIGVIIGCGASWIVKSAAHWPIYIQAWSVFLSFAVCTVTGVFFGWYPAKKAADLDPIEAIRYE